MADLLIAPYLPLNRRARVGQWELVPFGNLDEPGVVPDELDRPVRRLVEAYQVTGLSGKALGVVIFPSGTEVGAPFDHSEMRPLGHALLAGVVANNPPMAALDDEAEQLNAGYGVAAAENALLYGHPLGDGDSYVTQIGVLVKVMAYHHAPGDEPLPKVDPPVELPKPLWAAFDVEIADAAHGMLVKDDAVGRRLSRTLDWYRIALSNAEAITLNVRVGAARSALEVLTDPGGDSTQKLVRAYGRLVSDDETTETMYDPDDVSWSAKGPVPLTPDEWWLMRLCELRNAIVHGDEVPDALWMHEGHHQLDEMHDRLIAALRIFLAEQTGDEPLRRRLAERGMERKVREAYEMLQEPSVGPDDEEPAAESDSPDPEELKND